METSDIQTQKPQRSPQEQALLNERMAKLRAIKAQRRSETQFSHGASQTQSQAKKTKSASVAMDISPSGPPANSGVMSLPLMVSEPSHQATKSGPSVSDHQRSVSAPIHQIPEVIFPQDTAPQVVDPQIPSGGGSIQRIQTGAEMSNAILNGAHAHGGAKHASGRSQKSPDASVQSSENDSGTDWMTLVLNGLVISFGLWLLYNQLLKKKNDGGPESGHDQGTEHDSGGSSGVWNDHQHGSTGDPSPGDGPGLPGGPAGLPAAAAYAVGGKAPIINLQSDRGSKLAFIGPIGRKTGV